MFKISLKPSFQNKNLVIARHTYWDGIEQNAVASAIGRKFLVYSFWIGPNGQIKLRVADKAKAKFKQRVRQLTRRSYSQSISNA